MSFDGIPYILLGVALGIVLPWLFPEPDRPANDRPHAEDEPSAESETEG